MLHRTIRLIRALSLAGAPACAAVAPAARQPTPEWSAGLAQLESLVVVQDSDKPAPPAIAAVMAAAVAAAGRFSSRADSLHWAAAYRAAEHATGFHVVVSLSDRRLWVVGEAGDTLRSAPVSVGLGTTLRYGKRSWTFKTPRGMRTVLRKDADPIWIPPDWLYVEVAADHHLRVVRLRRGKPIVLSDARRLAVSDSLVGVIGSDGVFDELPVGEHIVFDSTLYIPPMGTKNRQVDGELGKYRLDLGDGYLLHGTPNKASIGAAATHGCVRLGDDDIEWLYDFVPVGTHVYIY